MRSANANLLMSLLALIAVLGVGCSPSAGDAQPRIDAGFFVDVAPGPSGWEQIGRRSETPSVPLPYVVNPSGCPESEAFHLAAPGEQFRLKAFSHPSAPDQDGLGIVNLTVRSYTSSDEATEVMQLFSSALAACDPATAGTGKWIMQTMTPIDLTEFDDDVEPVPAFAGRPEDLAGPSLWRVFLHRNNLVVMIQAGNLEEGTDDAVTFARYVARLQDTLADTPPE